MPPLRINPGLPLTPGKFRVTLAAPAVPPFARSSVFVYIVKESPGKILMPAEAWLRMRVLALLLPIGVPLATVSYVLPATGASAVLAPSPPEVPTAFVLQIAAVQSAPP